MNAGFAILTFILLFHSVQALTTDIKNSYLGLETAIVRIDGKIMEPIAKEQIEFKRKNVLIPFEFDIGRVYDSTYIWFVTPNTLNETNYTLIIKNIFVEELGVNKRVDLYLNFTVKNNISDYYITPGFISTREDYEIEVNSNVDKVTKINLEFPIKKELTITAGKNIFGFETEDIEKSTYKIVNFGKYKLPVYIMKGGEAIVTVNDSISITPSNIYYEREIGSKLLNYSFKIINVGGNRIEDIYPDYNDDNIKIVPTSKIDLEPGQEIRYNITLKKEANISEVVKIISEKNNINRELRIEIEFDNFDLPRNQTLINESVNNNNTGTYYCQELGGKECFTEQKCEGQIIKTRNNVNCCIGKCLLIEEEKSSSWIGYLIIAIALIAIVFAFIKYKKVKPSKTYLEKTLEDGEKKLVP